MTTTKKFARLMTLALSTSLLGFSVAQAAPPTAPTKMASKTQKAMPMRDAKGRFLKKSAMKTSTSMLKAPRKMPMRDAKGRFIKSTPGALVAPKK